MKVGPERLPSHLAQALAPIYLVAGEEPLLLAEAADAVRTAARAAGFTEREIHVVQRGFDWNALLADCDNLSLFSVRKIVELRLPGGKPGEPGAKALVEYASDPPPDTLLLVLAEGRWDKRAAGVKWARALESAGCLVEVRRVREDRLGQWVEQRMRARGLQPSREAVELMTDRVEGNLLAAVQEIDKLLLLHGEGPVDVDAVREAVADSARFDIFRLVDAALAGDGGRAARILDGLWSEGVAAPLILWALLRELRGLAQLAWRIDHGEPVESALAAARVWPQRKPLIRGALKDRNACDFHALLLQAGRIDRIVKGTLPGLPRQAMTGLVAALAGVMEPAQDHRAPAWTTR